MEVKAKRISENLFVLLSFSNFCVNIHDKIKCNEEKCEYKKYSNLSKKFLAQNDKCEQEKKNFFFLIVNYVKMFFVVLKIVS